jgi:hypothetical protein
LNALIRHRLASLTAVTALLTTLLTAPLAAQETLTDSGPLPPIAGITVQGGGFQLQTTAFNEQLARQGRGQLKRTMISLGVESWMRWNRVMLIANSQTFLPTRSAATNYTTELDGSMGMLSVGVPVVLTRRTQLFPMAGLGLSSSTVTLRRNGAVDFITNFRDIPSNGGRNVDITARRYQAQVGLGLDQVFQPSWPKLLMTVGLRAGYVAPLGDTRWRSGPERVIGAPELGAEGAYVRLSLGGVIGKRRYSTLTMIGTLLPFVGK